MEVESGGSPEPCSITMAAIHNLERWQAGPQTISFSLDYHQR